MGGAEEQRREEGQIARLEGWNAIGWNA